MAGIYPEIGVTASNTQNAQIGDLAVPGCEQLFYRNNCQVEFDPIQMNAIISEILNVATMSGDKYDCSKLDNMKTALTKLAAFCTLAVEPSPELADYVVGCFNGQNRRLQLDELRTLLGTCGLPTGTDPDTNDTVAMCVDGSNAQVAMSEIINLIVGNLPEQSAAVSPYRRGTDFWSQRWGENQDDTRSLVVTGNTAFVGTVAGDLGSGGFTARVGDVTLSGENVPTLFRKMTDGNWWALLGNESVWRYVHNTDDIAVHKSSPSGPIGGEGTSGTVTFSAAIELTPA